jgi:hypothetical protein
MMPKKDDLRARRAGKTENTGASIEETIELMSVFVSLMLCDRFDDLRLRVLKVSAFAVRADAPKWFSDEEQCRRGPRKDTDSAVLSRYLSLGPADRAPLRVEIEAMATIAWRRLERSNMAPPWLMAGAVRGRDATTCFSPRAAVEALTRQHGLLEPGTPAKRVGSVALAKQ